MVYLSLMLLDPGTINAINCILGMLLAAMMATFWVRSGRKVYAFHWMLAALFLAWASAFFLARTWLFYGVNTFVGTISVTLGMIFLLSGVQCFMGADPKWRFLVPLAACHAIGNACILALDAGTGAAMLVNSLFWAGLSSASLFCFRTGAPDKWKEWYAFPSLIFASHAAFHSLRLVLLSSHLLGFSIVSITVLQGISFAEASVFCATIFMSLLFSDVRLHNRQLQAALDEVQTLSGLLPICSGCKKIRDDAGYWTKLETYISQHSGAQFSHGLCPDCAMTLYPDVFAGKLGAQAQRVCAKHGSVQKIGPGVRT